MTRTSGRLAKLTAAVGLVVGLFVLGLVVGLSVLGLFVGHVVVGLVVVGLVDVGLVVVHLALSLVIGQFSCCALARSRV